MCRRSDSSCVSPGPRVPMAPLPLQVLPHAGEPGQQVLVLGQRHLQAALAGPRPLGENVQDEGGAVHHRHPQLLGEHPLLGGGQGVVKYDDIRPQASDQLADLLRLALPHKGAGVGGGAVLQHRSQAGSPRRIQQGGQLVQRFVRGVLLPAQAGCVQTGQNGAVYLFYFGFFKHIGYYTSSSKSYRRVSTAQPAGAKEKDPLQSLATGP